MHQADILQAVTLGLPRPPSLRKTIQLTQALGDLDEYEAIELVLRWVHDGCLVIGDATDSGGHEVALGDTRPKHTHHPKAPIPNLITAWTSVANATRRVAMAADRCKATLGTVLFPAALVDWRDAMSALSDARRNTVERNDVPEMVAAEAPRSCEPDDAQAS